jgi:hypothetical protein
MISDKLGTIMEKRPLIFATDEGKKRFDKGESRMINRLKSSPKLGLVCRCNGMSVALVEKELV